MASRLDAATLTVAWDPDTDPAVVGYRVAMGTQSGVYSVGVDAGTQTFAQFTNLTGGATYYFVVQAYDSAGNLSAPSAEVAGVAPVTSVLTIMCPAPTATSSTGGPVVVTYSVTVSGGVAPVSVACSPPSGSLFPVGSTPFQCTAQDAVGATATCSTNVVVTSTASTSPTTTPTAGTPVDFTGTVSSASGRCPTVTLNVSNTTVYTTNATSFSQGSCSSVSNGKQVRVKGVTRSTGGVTAQSITVVH
jgi:hypothetical protein